MADELITDEPSAPAWLTLRSLDAIMMLALRLVRLVVKHLDGKTMKRLKARAKRHGHSLQGEVKVILIEATVLSLREANRISAQWHARLAGHVKSDSAELIREDRSR